jgi:hypothetical protein
MQAPPVRACLPCGADALNDDVAADGGRGVSVVLGYCFCSNDFTSGVRLNELSGSERNDAANRVVRRYTDGDSIARNDFDSEAPHPAAQLRQHFMPRVTLDAV